MLPRGGTGTDEASPPADPGVGGFVPPTNVGGGGAAAASPTTGGAAPVCGDGVLGAGELCDDGNTDDADGCDGDCGVEDGWSCDGRPSECVTTCGDGVIAGDEQCDDQNSASEDGCSAECTVEHGWMCDGEASVCDFECGDSVVAVFAEECDDGDIDPLDGCDADCNVEASWECAPGDPSVCTVIQPTTATVGPDLGFELDDDGYDGSIDSMDCVTVPILGDGILTVAEVRVTLGLEHSFVGDFVFKVESPTGTISTIMSRPGCTEDNDDGSNLSGQCDSSNFLPGAPLTFRQDALLPSAEDVGAGIGNTETACATNSICEYVPNNGAGPGPEGLAEFMGELPGGDWRVCVGDAALLDDGSLEFVELYVDSTP